MNLLVSIAAGLAAVLHVFFFCMESLWWTKPAVYRRFRSNAADAQTTKSLALNQGFYNLFLAIGTFIGLGLMASGHRWTGVILVGWNCASMLGAAIVLLVSSPRMARGALIQGLAPLVALITLAMQYRNLL